MTVYTYTMNGTAAQGQTWQTTGTIELPPGKFPDALELALRLGFMNLTNGEAVFGRPGVGCNGPYSVKKFTIEETPT